MRTHIVPLALLIFALLPNPAQTGAAAEDAPIGRFDVFVEMPKDAPYVGEPLRLVLRSAIRARVAKDTIVQPTLTDFDWQQFGVDASGEEFVDGFWMPAHTRVLMIYPLRAGRLTIAPFKRRISYFTDNGDRAETEFISQPLTLEVRSHEGVGDPADFWLPAKSLRITDAWEPDPDRIGTGEMAKRVVTVEAEGITADRLPPLPPFRAPGVITFAGPVERRTIVTDAGPIGRAVYRWSVRPVSARPAIAPEIRLRWFDVTARIMREAAAPERRVAFIDARQETEAASVDIFSRLISPRPLFAALLGCVSAAAATVLLVSSNRPEDGSPRAIGRVLKRWRILHALRKSARKNDIVAFRNALRQLAASDVERWRRVAGSKDIAPALEAMNATLFAREAPHSPIELKPLARRIAAAWR